MAEAERPGAGSPANASFRTFAVRIALFFTALFFVAGTKLPYFPVWLDWRGLTTSEIALATAAPLFLRIVVGPILAMAADRWGDLQQAVLVLAVASLIALGGLAAADGFYAILAVSLLAAMATTGLMPLAETIAMSGVRRAGHDYGRMRLWGSLSFIAAGFIAGAAITGFGPGAVWALLVAGAAATVAAAVALPADPEASSSERRPFSFAGLRTLVSEPGFLLFLLAAGAIQSSHAVFYTFGVIEWQRQGLGPTWAATLWAIGVAAEIGLFAYSRAVVERLGAVGLLVAGALAALIRWLVMAFDPPLALLLPLQALHGLTFGAAHLGALHLMAERVPPSHASTAQALYASVTSGIGLGLATLVAGPIYKAYGSRAYLAMVILALIGIAAAMRLGQGRRQSG